MGEGRFLYNNLITDESMLTVSSLRYGIVTAALKEGSGSATLNPSGNYTGLTDREYILEIDSIAGGAEVGQATFRWSDGSGSWNASGVSTSAVNITLNNGVNVNWSSGSGADFVVGDLWYLKGINLFSLAKMLDLDRDTRYRSSILEAPNTLTVDLGSPQQVKALILFDHNLTAAATITVKANSSDSWGAPAFSEAITWSAGKILHYLSTPQTYEFWQLQISDPANAYSYIEIGEIFLGSFLELSANYLEGYSRPTKFLQSVNQTQYGITRKRFFNQQKTFRFNYTHMAPADVASMEALVDAICSRSSGIINPIWFNSDSAVPADTWLVSLDALPIQNSKLSYFDMPLQFTEVLQSV